jgi:hypothetical protein
MSGAYTVSFVSNGIIPIVPVQETGVIKFGRVFMSFAWDNLVAPNDPPLEARMRIWTRQGTVRFDGPITIPRGRTAVLEMESQDVAVSITAGGPGGLQELVTALVEYET